MNAFEQKLDLAIIEAIHSPKLFRRAVKAAKSELSKYPQYQQNQIIDLIVNKLSLIFVDENQSTIKAQLRNAILLGMQKDAIYHPIATTKV